MKASAVRRLLPLWLAAACAGSCNSVHVPTAAQYVESPEGKAFARVDGMWYPLSRETHYSVQVAVKPDPPPAGDSMLVAMTTVFTYAGRADAHVRVRWTDDEHLVISYRSDPHATETRGDHQGIEIIYARER